MFHTTKKVRTLLLMLLCLALLAIAGCDGSKDSAPDSAQVTEEKSQTWKDDDVLMKLGERQITYAGIKDIYNELTGGANPLTSFPENEQKSFIYRYYHMQLFATEARERGLEQDDKFRARTRYDRYKAMMPAFKQLQIVDKHTVTTEQLMQYIPPALDDVRMRIIVKADAAEAKAAYDRAMAGEDFGELAMELSEGFLKMNGGLTDWVNVNQKGKFPSVVVERFLATPVGEIIEPFYQDIGFLVVKIEEKRTAEALRMQELMIRRNELTNNVYKFYYTEEMEKLSEQAEIELDEEVVLLASGELKDESKSMAEVYDSEVLTVNGESFKIADILGDLSVSGHSGQPIRQRVLKFIPTVLIAQECAKLDCESHPKFIDIWKRSEDKELATELKLREVEPIDSTPTTDEEFELYMKSRPDKFMIPAAYEISVIVMKQGETADKALAELEKGAEFARLARELGTQLELADKDGYMGFVVEKDVPPLALDAIKGIEDGSYTGKVELASPDETPLFLIIKRVSVRNAAPMDIESVKTPKTEEEIKTLKRTKRLKTLRDSLAEKYGYEICFESEEAKGE